MISLLPALFHLCLASGVASNPMATTTAAGRMSAPDKVRLDAQPLVLNSFHQAADGNDWSPAFSRAEAALPRNGGSIYVPPGTYPLSDSIHLYKNVTLVGAGGFANQPVTILQPPVGKSGIVIDNAVTSPVAGQVGGDRSIINNIAIVYNAFPVAWAASTSMTAGAIRVATVFNGYNYSAQGACTSGSSEPFWDTTEGGTTSDGTCTWMTLVVAGIRMKARATVTDFAVVNTAGDGIHIFANYDDTPSLNANNWNLERGQIYFSKGWGLSVAGNNCNIGGATNVDVSVNEMGGFQDQSALGNHYLRCHAATNGLANWAPSTSYTLGTVRVPIQDAHFNGFRYKVTARTTGITCPSEPTWPVVIGQTVVDCGVTWTNLATFNATSYRIATDIANSNASTLVGCYAEDGQNLIDLRAPVVWIGNANNGNRFRVRTDNQNATIINRTDSTPIEFKRYDNADPSKYVIASVGGDPSTPAALTFRSNEDGSQAWRIAKDIFNPNWWALSYNSAGSQTVLAWPSNNSTNVGGTPIPFGSLMIPHRFWLANPTEPTAEVISVEYRLAAPTTGTYNRGSIAINAHPTELGSSGSKYLVESWRCSTGGTPGTWLESRTLTGN